MIRTLLWRDPDAEAVQGQEELVAEWTTRGEGVLWADFSGLAIDAERSILVERFGLHPLAIQDAQRERHQPKIEAFGGYVFILLKGLGPDSETFAFDTIQIAMFVAPRFLVTRHSGPSPSIDHLWDAVVNDARADHAPDSLALRLSRISIDRYLKRLLALEPRLEDLEQEIVVRPRDEILAELMGLKTNLRKFRRVFVYHVAVFRELMNDPPAPVRAERIHEIKDVYEHQERASSLASLYYEVASDLIDGYISLASHRLNNIMKILTIVTAIFVPLSFLAGVYGMNFENMPELKSRSGYFVLLGVMGAIAFVLLTIFRRRRWI